MNVTVELGERSYDVVVRRRRTPRSRRTVAATGRRERKVCVAGDLGRARDRSRGSTTPAASNSSSSRVPDGESAKTIGALEHTSNSLAELRLSRDDVVVGVGGGAVTDLAGFAAGVLPARRRPGPGAHLAGGTGRRRDRRQDRRQPPRWEESRRRVPSAPRRALRHAAVVDAARS